MNKELTFTYGGNRGGYHCEQISLCANRMNRLFAINGADKITVRLSDKPSREAYEAKLTKNDSLTNIKLRYKSGSFSYEILTFSGGEYLSRLGLTTKDTFYVSVWLWT